MLPSINKRHWTKFVLPMITLLGVIACNHESTAPAPSASPATATSQPTDFKGWMKLHESELTSARLAYQTAKAKHILPGQPFDRNAFDVDYKAALQEQGIAAKQLPNSVRVSDVWNPTQQTTAQYLDAHQVKGALRQYILTLEQNLKKAADKLLQEHNAANSAARSPADDDWGPDEGQTRIAASQALENSAEAASANSSLSYQEKDAIWMVTGMTINYLPEFINLTKQELGFGTGAANVLDGQIVQRVLGPFGRLLKRLFNVVTTVVLEAAALIVVTVLAVAANVGLPGLSAYINVIYAATVGVLVGGMYKAVAENKYLCVYHDDGGRC